MSPNNFADWRKSTFLAVGSVAAAAVGTAASLLAMLILLRVLPAPEAGRLALLIELLYVVGLLGSLGQAALQARLYHQAAGVAPDWAADLRSTVWVTLPATLMLTASLVWPFQLTFFEFTVIALGAELFVLLSCLTSVLTQQRCYVSSSALLRLPNALLLLPAALFFFQGNAASPEVVLGCLLLFLLLAVWAGLLVLKAQVGSGSARISYRQRLAGSIFLFSMVALLIPQRGLIIVAGAFVEPQSLAALAAALSLLRVFDLIGEPAGRVYATEIARAGGAVSRKFVIAPWIVTALLGGFLHFSLPPLIHHFYAGRFDAILPLLPWLIAAAAFRFLEVVPRGVLAYRASATTLRQLTWTHSLVALAGLALMVKWTLDYSLAGAAWGGFVIAAIRLGVSCFFLSWTRTAPGDGVGIEPLKPRGEKSPV